MPTLAPHLLSSGHQRSKPNCEQSLKEFGKKGPHNGEPKKTPGTRVDALADLGIHYPSEDDVSTRVWRRVGVPAKAIRVLDAPIVNTDQELDIIGATLQNRGGQKVIIVTGKSHTRRVHRLWDKHYASRGQLIVHGVSDDPFQPYRWWRYPGSLTQVVHEIFGIANTLTGMPVQPVPLKTDAVLADDLPLPTPPAAD